MNNTEDDICRICFGGEDLSLGRLFSPCLCKGTQRFVHTGCLNQWRHTNRAAYFECPQCKYRYRTSRTQIFGLASNRTILTAVTILAFLFLVFIAGFLGSLLLYFTNSLPDQPLFESFFWWFGGTSPFASPLSYGEAIGGSVERSFDMFVPDKDGLRNTPVDRLMEYIGFVGREKRDTWTFAMISHFALGFSVIGIVSFLQIAISYSLVAPLHHLRIFRRSGTQQARGNRPNERERGIDFAAILVIIMVLIGTVKAFRSLYRFIERQSWKMLARIEEQILEVNS